MVRPVDIMIAGAQRCGTTALKDHLAEHPDVVTHRQLELSHFYADEEYERGWEAGFRRYFGRHAPIPPEISVLGKHAHLVTSRPALERLRRHNPAVKIVISLRDPVSRAYSSFRWEHSQGGDEGDFESFVRRWSGGEEAEPEDRWREPVYLGQGRYAEHLEALFDVFDREQVRVLILEEYLADPATRYSDLLDWLELSPGFRPDFRVEHNPARPPRHPLLARLFSALRSERNPVKRLVRRLLPPGAGSRITRWARSRLRSPSGEYPPLSPEARTLLREHFEPHDRRLETLLGRRLDLWREEPVPPPGG